MNMKNKLKIMGLLIGLTNISLLSVGFGSFIFSKMESDETSINIGVGTYKEGIDGISITPIKSNLKIGKYLFYDDETKSSSLSGSLIYKIVVNPSVLDNDLKINNDDNSGYKFNLKGALSINELPIFNEGNRYINDIKFNDSVINSITYGLTLVTFSFDIETTSKTNIQNFYLEFNFSNQIIVKEKENIADKKFSLLLKRWFMNSIKRKSMIILLSSLILNLVGYASFLVYEVKNSGVSVEDNVYSVEFHYINDESIEKTFIYNDLEEDSYFDLPHLSYARKIFGGWSFKTNRETSLRDLDKTSIKYLKENYSNEITFSTNKLKLYDVSHEVDSNHTLLSIEDNTENSLRYYLITESTSNFNLFNIKYVYNSVFVNLTINNLTYDINDTFDLSPYGGKELNVVLNKIS